METILNNEYKDENIIELRNISKKECPKEIKVDFGISKNEMKKVLKRTLKIAKKWNQKNISTENCKIFVYNFENENREMFLYGLEASFIPNDKERYSFIYDKACDYLDDFFYGKNYCDFQNNKCGEKRNTSSTIGCCRHYKYKILGPIYGGFVQCEHLQNYRCNIRCLPCKLFTCDYLEKKGVKFRVKDIFILDTFFNPLQKYTIKTMVYTPKEKIIKTLLRQR